MADCESSAKAKNQAQHLAGLLERCLHQRDDVERVGLVLAVEKLEGGEQERRERLIERDPLGHFAFDEPVLLAVDVFMRDEVGRLFERTGFVGVHEDADHAAALFSVFFIGIFRFHG